MLVKVRAVGKEREEMKRMADIFRGAHHRRHREELHHRADRRLRQARRLPRWPSTAPSILETVRTGASGIGRGESILRV